MAVLGTNKRLSHYPSQKLFCICFPFSSKLGCLITRLLYQGETNYRSLLCSNSSEIQSFQSMFSKLTAAVFDQEIKLKQNNNNEVKKEEGKAKT